VRDPVEEADAIIRENLDQSEEVGGLVVHADLRLTGEDFLA